MKRVEVEKNRLDLAYQRNLQLLNTLLLIGAGSIITYFVALVLDITKAFQYTIILVIISLVTITIYKKLNYNLRKISKNIGNLVK